MNTPNHHTPAIMSTDSSTADEAHAVLLCCPHHPHSHRARLKCARCAHALLTIHNAAALESTLDLAADRT